MKSVQLTVDSRQEATALPARVRAEAPVNCQLPTANRREGA
jgi:hypothetical protein